MKPDDTNRERTPAGDDEVERLLVDIGAFERATIAESRRIDDAPGAARVRATLDREWSSERRASRLRYGLAAAAVLVLALGAWWAFARDDGPAGVSVGQSHLEILAPKDGVTRFDVIRWRSKTRDPDVRYRVHVVDARTKGELLVRNDVAGTELSLQDVATDAWYDIQITVEERGGDGALRDAAHASARR
ncbi:MAG: hypothetical protein K8S98_15455 [Planctomycetes bacterium]|nr:hypothetical protein [Planctomycetota bacterium]